MRGMHAKSCAETGATYQRASRHDATMKTKKPKSMTRNVTLEIRRSAYAVYRRADKQLARRGIVSPGAETLMAVKLEVETDADFLADLYCLRVLKQTPRHIASYYRN